MAKKISQNNKDSVEKETFLKLSLSQFIAIIIGFLALIGTTVPIVYQFGRDIGRNEIKEVSYNLEKENDRLKSVIENCQLVDSCSATIVNPVNRSLINHSDYFDVKGRINFIPSEYHLWLVVCPSNSGLWWSQVGEIFREKDGTWNGKARLGGNKRGEEYLIRVLIVDKDAHTKFSSEYLSNGNSLPPVGIKILDQITVIRD